MAIILEPLRVLTRFFMHCSTTTHGGCSVPHLCDLASPDTSVVVVVQQYLAGLLHAGRGRLPRPECLAKACSEFANRPADAPSDQQS
eukprot:13467400-Alexandrium_andersonii.AAC.1